MYEHLDSFILTQVNRYEDKPEAFSSDFDVLSKEEHFRFLDNQAKQ